MFRRIIHLHDIVLSARLQKNMPVKYKKGKSGVLATDENWTENLKLTKKHISNLPELKKDIVDFYVKIPLNQDII